MSSRFERLARLRAQHEHMAHRAVSQALRDEQAAEETLASVAARAAQDQRTRGPAEYQILVDLDHERALRAVREAAASLEAARAQLDDASARARRAERDHETMRRLAQAAADETRRTLAAKERSAIDEISIMRFARGRV